MAENAAGLVDHVLPPVVDRHVRVLGRCRMADALRVFGGKPSVAI